MLRIIFTLIFRFILPLVLLICWTKSYLIACLVLSCAAVVAQVAFYFIYPVSTLDDTGCISSNFTADFFKTLGLQKLIPTDFMSAARNIGPDLVTLVAAALAVVFCYLHQKSARNRPTNQNLAVEDRSPNVTGSKLGKDASPGDQSGQSTSGLVNEAAGINQNVSPASQLRSSRTKHGLVFLLRLSDILVIILLALLVSIWPCLLSIPYLVAFLVLTTWWAIFAPVRRHFFNAAKVFLFLYCALHLTVIYWYQLWIQVPYFKSLWNFVDANDTSLLPKLIGLTPLLNETRCASFYPMIFDGSISWPAYANAMLLVLFYIYCSFQFLMTRKGISAIGPKRRLYNGVEIHPDDESSVHEELLGMEDEEESRVPGNAANGAEDQHNAQDGAAVPKRTEQMFRFISEALSPKKGYKHGSFVSSIIAFAVRHIYALTLVSMMAWAITYHAWLSFVWLLTACLIWLLPNSRKWCLWLSPLILLYAEVLVSLQFAYGIKTAINGSLEEDQWPDYNQVGLETPRIACIPLLIKIFYTLPFVITLRLYLRQRKEPELEQSDPTVYGTFSVMVTEPVIAGSSFLGGLLVKYWIFVVGLVLLLISIRQPVVAYGACYMAFFVVLITVLQVSFRFWRFMLYCYLSILIAFSIAVLLLVYTYQFPQVPEIWQNFTHWPNGTNSSIDIFKDLGLTKYESGSLFVTLLTPISFLIVVCLQLKFFHAGFLRITNISALLQSTSPLDAVPDSGRADRCPTTTLSKCTKLLKHYFGQLNDLLWRLLEIHVSKFVALALLLVAIYDVNAVNFVLVIFVSVMVPCRRLSMLVSVIACSWTAFIVLVRMVFQMTLIQAAINKTLELNRTCEIFLERRYNISTDPAKWAGFEKTENIASYLKEYVLIFVLLTFQAIVYLRQRYRRVSLNKMTPARGIVFPEITRINADESLTRCLQYLINYCFYKFGIELTFIAMVIDIATRLDLLALIYSIWLIFLFSLSRRVLSRFWYFFVLFMAIIIPLQYALCVGLPPSACIDYPWLNATSNMTNLFHWLYLPNYGHSPGPTVLVGDFVVFLFACCQLYVFNIELSGGSTPNYEGGDNSSIDASQPNPVPNFINYTKSYLDIFKTIIFVYFHWITLTVVFVAAVSGISLFSLGYLLGAFIILWTGNDLYTQPMKSIRLRWHSLMYYNIFVIITKVFLQAVSCVYVNDLCERNHTAVIQVFTLSCLRGVNNSLKPQCQAKAEEAELIYDAIIFVFVILQLRIFASWYFRHTIVEFNAERIMSYRGAMLMNQLIKKDMKEQQDKEKKIYEKLTAKTNKIRDKYLKRLAGTEIYEATTYATAKRAGDYYMFDYDSEEEDFLELDAPKEAIAPEISPETQLRGVGPLQLAHIAVTKDLNLKETVSEAEKADQRRTLSSKDRTGTSESTRTTSASMGESSSVSPGTSSSADPTKTVATPTAQRRRSGDASDFEQITDIDASCPTKIDGPDPSGAKSTDGFCVTVLKFLRYAAVSVPDHCAFWFNMWSRDYRYVAYVLKKEKRTLKENLAQHQPQGTLNNVKKVRETIFSGEFGQRIHLVKSESEIETVEKEVQDFWLQHNVIVRFFISSFYLLLSHTELLCYIMIILDQMANSSIISLPLPFLVFLWGTLCSPRPPQFFWITTITYTMAMIVVKFICQFDLGSRTVAGANEPFAARRIIGIEQTDYYASWDVALLMVLFFHRYVLKTLGLWKVANINDEFDDLPQPEQIETNKIAEPLSPSAISVFVEKVPKTAGSIELQDLTKTAGTSGMIQEFPNKQGTAEENRLAKAEADKKGRLAYCQSCVSFYRRLLNPAFRYIMDLYVFLFICDMICFLILTFGYSSFGVAVRKGEKGAENADVVANIKSNKVPLGFVIMLVSLMILIIIDRGIYLRKNLVAKLTFQHFLVFLVHGWIFFALPAITDLSTQNNGPAKFWYFVKCVYFLLSAWQIRNGYPSRIFGNLLTKKYNLLNFSLFSGFMVAPFLFELRTLIDWIWTDTCMPLFDFFTMENIYAVIYRLKCMRKMEKDYPVPKGIAKGAVVKYGMGCPILLLIILLVWLPLLLFALVNAIGMRSLPIQARMTISIEGYPPLYTMDAQKTFLQTLSNDEYVTLTDVDFRSDKTARTFLRDYTANDTLNAVFRISSNIRWAVSEPSLNALINDLSQTDIDMTVEFEFTRPRQNAAKEPVRQTSKYIHTLNQQTRENFKQAILGPSTKAVIVPGIYPLYVEIPPVGQIQPASPLIPSESFYFGISFQLIRINDANWYWNVTAVPPDQTNSSNSEITVKAFVDKVFPSAIDAITSGGIIGVYLVVVLAAANILRNLVVNKALDIIIAEMPDVDRILQLCMDIFLVREARDFLLELDLFAKLLFLFRSPETLIKWTRPKKD